MAESRKPRRVQQRSIDAKARIIEIAAREFVENGYRGTSVNDIIVGADSNKNFFYNRFPMGKRDVAKDIMENTLTMDGLQPQRLKSQEIVDIGMILAYRIANEEALLAALKLSFEHEAGNEYGTPWPDWVKFNVGQIEEAQLKGEIRPHVDPAEQARQIPGTWSGLIQTAIVLDDGLQYVQKHVARSYRNLMGVLAVPEVLADLDFAVDRGERLYTDFLLVQKSQPESAQE